MTRHRSLHPGIGRLIRTGIGILASILLSTCQAPAGPPEPTSPVSPRPTPTRSDTASPAPPRDAIEVVAVGDIVCEPGSGGFDGSDPSRCQHRATARLIADADAVLALGDLQYEHGSLSAFILAYDPTWGRFADITYPAPGNHEYETSGAEGYFEYWASKDRPTGGFGSAWYSFDLGSWHLVSLDSNCLSCGESSAQDVFLERDLARTNEECVLAFWHHPYFNSGSVHGEESLVNVRALWDDLYAAGADVVLVGHEHNYQRYAKQDPSGHATRRGIRQFVVGTGGKSLYGLEEEDPNLQVADATHFGVLRLFLGERSYSWSFVGIDGSILDHGGPTRCN
jgi:hypothetical protein